MSIYFQYPAIDDYPNLIYPIKNDKDEEVISLVENSLNEDQIIELKDYLNLKQL